jgi:hypothetical protein
MLLAKVSVALVLPMLLYLGITYWLKIPEARYLFSHAVSAVDKIRNRMRERQ